MYYSFDNTSSIETNIANKNYETRRENYSDLRIKPISSDSLKLAVVQDFRDPNSQNKDPLDQTNIIKDDKVVIKWFRHESGLIGSSYLAGDWKYIPQNDTYEIKNKKKHYAITSNQLNVTRTYPFIWAEKDKELSIPRCCGINYVPPNGSIAIASQLATGETYLNNYVISNPDALYPVLKPGEISIMGYGNNFIYWGQSDKISIYCKSNEGEYDRDDNNYTLNKDQCKKNLADCELEININANDRFIEIIAEQNCSNIDKKDSKLNKYSPKLLNYSKTSFIISPSKVEITIKDNKNETQYIQDNEKIIKTVYDGSSYSSEMMTSEKIKIKTDEYIIDAKKTSINSSEKTNIQNYDHSH